MPFPICGKIKAITSCQNQIYKTKRLENGAHCRKVLTQPKLFVTCYWFLSFEILVKVGILESGFNAKKSWKIHVLIYLTQVIKGIVNVSNVMFTQTMHTFSKRSDASMYVITYITKKLGKWHHPNCLAPIYQSVAYNLVGFIYSICSCVEKENPFLCLSSPASLACSPYKSSPWRM